MKKVFNHWVMPLFLAFLVSFLTSCEKNVIIINPQLEESVWQSTIIMGEGDHLGCLTNRIYFNWDKTGYVENNYSVPGLPDRNHIDVFPINYTFNSPDGIIYTTIQDSTYSNAFTISGKYSDTLTLFPPKADTSASPRIFIKMKTVY